MANDILKKTLRHYIDLDMYSNTVIDDMAEMFDDLEDDCDSILLAQDYYNTKSEYNVAYQLIKEKVSEFQSKLNKRLDDESETVLEKELEFLAEVYGASLVINKIPASRLLFVPIVDGKDTVKGFSEKIGKNILHSYDNSMRSGYIFGQKSADIKESVKRNLAQVKNGMNSGINTAIPSFAKTTDKIVFLNNKEEVVWCSILDGRTCIVCGSLNGLRFKSAADAPACPQHFRCRCFLTVASVITEPMMSYEEYINSLSDEEQYHILGKNRYELHKKGLSLEHFVNNGRKLRLDEIDTSDLEMSE